MPSFIIDGRVVVARNRMAAMRKDCASSADRWEWITTQFNIRRVTRAVAKFVRAHHAGQLAWTRVYNVFQYGPWHDVQIVAYDEEHVRVSEWHGAYHAWCFEAPSWDAAANAIRARWGIVLPTPPKMPRWGER